jgi:dethiobiotin synthetase
MRQIFFITGTDTGVGKTVLTVLLAQFLREGGVNVAALKPVCSGNRDDARKLFAALNGAVEVQGPKSKVQSCVLSLDEINPWHFRAPVAPSLAAKLEKKSVKLSQVVAHARALQKRFDVLLVEGAGGLLSPLGENFDSRDLISALRATPVIVAANRLGAVNHLLLTLAALPKNLRVKTQIVLMSLPKPDAAANSNANLLAQFFPAGKIFTLPWLGKKISASGVLKNPPVRRTLRALAR